MNENKDTDSKESGEYEDDFEKDLEWLINEKEIDASIIEMAYEKEENINQELKENETEIEHMKQLSDLDKSLKDEMSPRRNDFISVPSIQCLDRISDSDSENSSQESKLESQKDLEEEEDEEVSRYIKEKIIQANKLLQTQEPVDEKRERKLKFKDKLVDLEVPPLEDSDTYRTYFENESSMSGKLSQLCISSELGQEKVLLSLTDGSFEENKDMKILVERDGKFELLNLQDIESQGFLPPIINANSTEHEPQQLVLRSPNSSVNGIKKEEPSAKIHITQLSTGEPSLAYVPQPPLNPKTHPRSAATSDRNKANGKSHHRTQSANISPVTSTYYLSLQQKELQKQLEKKREKLKREEQQRKIEEEKQKKKENDMVFKAWLQKKREKVVEMRRIQRAKQIEDMSNRQEERDPQEAFRLWLKKKHEEQMKERKTEELRKQEECLFFLKGTEGREKAFKQWLRRKRIEKIAEQQAVEERARQLRLEARRSKYLQNHLWNMSEAKAFRFTDYYN
ncbi:PREDICTED: coiled-coil domain-containing protein 181 [Chinchilla lanigera]|uniref:Coiled-coil domain-containing protein 181 n=1 Tax=Chinchilla lanigera TaxID=34839 RepID=A0A8C2V0L4_CHILA|nr:PREDICTED: coiled-coil domain-containing protein 181 [Chinchilla lanigera]XP_005398255.1 PREDICTED: coiled-coil domain-containing protein 181 [Chinchilla lanigera]XP_005398256.1 PREDICTED: coiled-coil domain-containing protein 181 [Chinchilla lanigera]XP_005398257.1 PREDICTED: coiled-coil domain-containing protein 181 [Chinchilla lanigera]XP_013376858.1 PREDICTED: coiled-coil domain-containing protein 181 [Chinchilla lanigera]XP_013376860.1 PREDICTED: coiled-coil domain-containing protein 1